MPPETVRFSGFGRGRDLDRDGTITDQEGVRTPEQPSPLASIGLRDGLRQTALDNMALVRAIGRGVDVDGDGSEDLRRDGIVYYAQSLGGIYGTMLMGVDQRVRAGALNVPGGPILDIARQSPAFRELVAADLKGRRPGLLNGGRDGFTESVPLFGDPPVTKPARGALPIQDAFAAVNWLNRAGSPETFAPLLRRTPLGGVGAKKVLYQFAYGDQTVPNPTSATLMRAGGLQDVTTFYRNDRTPSAGRNPHGFLLDPTITGRNLGQAQVLDFLASGGETISDPDGPAPVFEVPIADPASLETLNFAQEPATGEPPPEPASRATGSCTGTTTGSGGRACASRAGFRSLRVSARGRRVRFRFAKRVAGRVTVGIFQSSVGRRRDRQPPGGAVLPRPVVHVERPRQPGQAGARRVPVRPRPRQGRRRGVRRPPGHAAPPRRPLHPGRALVLPPAQLRAADPVQARRAGVRRPRRPCAADRVPPQLTVAGLDPAAPRREGRQALRARATPLAPDLPPPGLLAAARAGAVQRAPHGAPRRAHRDLDAPLPPPLTPPRTLTQLCQGSLHSPEEWMR